MPSPPPTAAATPARSSIDTGGKPKALQCMRFGCQKKYHEADNTATSCSYHKLPPVFHETAKFWACCPDKKCYDWDSFMGVKGCMTSCHTTEKPDQSGKSLGGGDVRSGNTDTSAPKLKSIDEFNAQKAASGGGTGGAGDAIAKMYQLRQAMDKAGVSGDLFDRAKEAVSARVGGDHETIHAEVVTRLTACLEAMEKG
uniref:CHORD domain-containing protein n=1 Tax=Florenciella parvula TaxID=236787 RepID=A0A7S2CNZ2_9STRA